MKLATRKTSEWLRLIVLGLLVVLHFWFPIQRSRQKHDSWSSQNEGKKAFFLLAEERAQWYGFRAQRNLRRLLSLPPRLTFDDSLCLLGPERMPTEAEWIELLDWVGRGGSLVVAARHDAPELEIDVLRLAVRRWYGSAPDGGVAVEGDTARNFGRAFTTLLSDPTYRWRTRGRLEFPDDAGFQTLVDIRGVPQAVSKRYGRGLVVVLATDFPFSNEAMVWKEQANAELACRLIDASSPDGLTRNVIVDEALNLSGTPKAVGLLFDPFLRPVTIQLLILVFLFAWWQSRRFGPLLPETATMRHDIVDHTDMLGMLYFRTHAAPHALRAYLRQMIAQLKLKTFRTRDERVLAPIARRLNMSLAEVRRILRSASRAAKDSELDRGTAADYIQQLSLLRAATETAGGRALAESSSEVEADEESDVES